MRTKIIYIILVAISSLTACSGFLEENSQNMAYVETIDDLDELLVGEVYFKKDVNYGFDPKSAPLQLGWASTASSRFISHFLMDDDIEELVAGIEHYTLGSTEAWIRYSAAATFYWQPNPYKDHEGGPYKVSSWTDYYKRIAAANSILFQLNEVSTEKKDTLAPRVEGEARFLRAAYYFMLVNTYAQPYNKETAATEPGVPLKTSETVEDRFFARNSVAEVYKQIVNDLERAVVCLKEVALFPRPVRANYAAAATLLSRVYLYMEEYDKAITYADEAIKHPAFSLLDLNTHPKDKSFCSLSSPETLFSQRGTFMAYIHANDSLQGGSFARPTAIQTSNGYTTSENLLASYDDTDLRKEVFFVPHHIDKSTFRCLKVRELNDDVVGEDHVIRLAEASLNKTEAQAALGQDGEARSTLRILLEKRYAPTDIPELTESGAALVNYIREERRRELCYEGHRWFDLRRYAVNSKFPFTKAIEHKAYKYIKISDTEGNFREIGKYVLKPYPEDKAAYVMPLPDYAVLFNEGVLEQNPARPERSLLPLD